jgi:hypothetical protein
VTVSVMTASAPRPPETLSILSARVQTATGSVISPMKWDNRELGLWSLTKNRWFSIGGTTPRNADYWNFEFAVNEYSVNFFFGKHIGMEYWWGDEYKVHEIKPRNCKCFSCQMHQPLSPELRKALFEKFCDPNYKPKKLPPRE